MVQAAGNHPTQMHKPDRYIKRCVMATGSGLRLLARLLACAAGWRSVTSACRKACRQWSQALIEYRAHFGCKFDWTIRLAEEVQAALNDALLCQDSFAETGR